MMSERSFNCLFYVLILAFAGFAYYIDEIYWISLLTRAVIFAIAGIGLNFALGYGGLVSFGHAAFFGIGGYVMGILASHAQSHTPLIEGMLTINGSDSMLLILGVTSLVGGLSAFVIGMLSLRTTGVYFIMITLAFSQMLYYFTISWPAYGGEDGLSIYVRNHVPGVNMQDPVMFFVLVLGVMSLILVMTGIIRNSAFGLVLNAVRQIPERVEMLGIKPFNVRLYAFVISGIITALAGALFANLNKFISPTMFSWQMSGEIMVFVILGGVTRLMGPVAGALAFVFLEEFLGGLSEYWHIYLGGLLLCVVLFAKGGIVGACVRPEVSRET